MFTIPKAFLGLAIVAMAGFHVPVALAQRSWQVDERVVAIVGDHQIRMTDLDAQIWEDLRDLQFEIHNLRHEKLKQMIEKMLVEQEAQMHGQSAEEFVLGLFGITKRSERLREEAGVEIYLEVPEPPGIDVSPDDDAYKGPTDAPVTIIEFSDFQCPYCKEFQQVMTRLLEAYPSQIRLVYRDFPLPSHPNAFQAAEAAECAKEQGKFWEYHDLLFENNTQLDKDSLKLYATRLGLEDGRFDRCLESGRYSSEVRMDRQDGLVASVKSTPTVFVNGMVLRGTTHFLSFRFHVERELKKAGIGAATSQAAEDVVAIVGDRQIRMTGLDAQIWERIEDIESEIYNLRHEKLEEMIEKMLLEQEAQKHGQSAEEFVYAIFEAAKLSEQEIDEIYTRNERRFRTQQESESVIKGRIRQGLDHRRGRESYQSMLRELREKAGVQIHLEEPVPPRMDAGLQLPVQGQNTGAREITGRVYNARTSQPIEGAELEIQVRSIMPSSPSNPMLFNSRSDSKGQFQAIIDTPGSQVLFSITRQGYIPIIEEAVFPPSDFRLSKDFGLLPGGSLRSTVKDAVTQELIPGASVRVFMDVPQVAGPQPGIGGYAGGEDGRFEIDGLLEAEGTAFAQSRRYAFDYRRVSIRAGEVTSVDFALQRSGTVSGVVVDANGTPLANREVSTVQLDNEVVSLISQAVSEEEVTDSDGKFTISTNLAAGKAFALEVNPVISGSAANAATEFLPTVSEPMVIAQAGGSITGVQLVMRKGVEVSIRVTDKGGNPLAGARVRLRKRLPGNPLELPSTVVSEASRVGVSSNATGTVLFQGVSSGEWLLMVGLSGYKAHRATVKVDLKNATFDVPLNVFVPSR